MEELFKQLSNQNSGFSITRKHKVISLTIGEVTDCFFHNLDMMGSQAINETCLVNDRFLTDEQTLALREKITTNLLNMIQNKIDQIALELF